MTDFNGGSPVSKPGNPNGSGAPIDPGDSLGSLNPEQHEIDQLAQLDAYGSSPVTDDAAAQRPLNPPSIAGDAANE